MLTIIALLSLAELQRFHSMPSVLKDRLSKALKNVVRDNDLKWE